MRASRAYFDAHKYTPSPEEAIEIANRRFTVANARSAIDVAFAFKAHWPASPVLMLYSPRRRARSERMPATYPLVQIEPSSRMIPV